jgi:radical SAM superfamily enzyme YgiQ (UPF0313 family)
MTVVLISLFNYDNFALRILFSYLRTKGIPVFYIGFKRMRRKPTRTLRNDFIELYHYHSEVTKEDIDTLLEELGRLKPILIGISLQSAHFQIAKLITQAIKERFKVPVIWGSSHPTVDPENCMKYTDMICVGEGFDALLELSLRILQDKPYYDIRNLWYNVDGKIIRNETRPLLNNLDILPFASFDSENKIYIDEGRVQKEKIVDYFGFGFTDTPLKMIHQTMTSFGCPMGCSFCINALDYNKFRRRSVSNVMQELIEVKQRNPHLKMIFFWDNIFTINKKWCLEFSQIYREKINLPFFAYPHPLFADMDVLVALRKAGWSATAMGIQSGSYSLRKQLYDRVETNEQVLETAYKLNRLKEIKGPRKYFRIYYDYIKNNPLEGKRELKENLDLILKLPKGFVFQSYNLSFFPNYPITKHFLQKRYISENDIEGNIRTSATNWMTTFDTKKEYRGFLRRYEYYYLLFSLAQFKIFPNFLIKKIEGKNIFIHNLHILYWICRIVRFIELSLRSFALTQSTKTLRVIPLKFKIKYRTLVRYK